MLGWVWDDRSVSSPEVPPDGWAEVVGQPEAVATLRAAVAHPVHAYLFVGPSGSGKRAALRAFAADLLSAGVSDPVEVERHRHLALTEHHPDLVIVDPEGGIFRGGSDGGDEGEATIVIREAFRAPVETDRKVVALIGFHTANEKAVGVLLKTIEEPPERTILILLNDQLPDEQSAVASRCMRVEFGPLSRDVLAEVLQADGVDAERAAEVIAMAGGDLARARVLAADDRLQLRVRAWREVPLRLDDTGARAAALVADLRTMIDDAMAPLKALNEAELVSFEEEVERYGLRRSAGRRKELQARQRRVERRFRSDELKLGLANLAAVYRDEATVAARTDEAFASLQAIHATNESLVVNPNEELALQVLFLALTPIRP